jgi:DNA-binding NarL/FixJ family response regulator
MSSFTGNGYAAFEAAGIPEAQKALDEEDFFAVILDIDLKGQNGMGLVNFLKGREKDLGVKCPIIIIYTQFEDYAHITTAMKLGADGYVSKGSSAETLRSAVEFAAEGRTFIDPALGSRLVRTTEIFGILTRREQEIYALVLEGQDNCGIARKFGISVRTVENHLSIMYSKLCVNSRDELLAL